MVKQVGANCKLIGVSDHRSPNFLTGLRLPWALECGTWLQTARASARFILISLYAGLGLFLTTFRGLLDLTSLQKVLDPQSQFVRYAV